ncbi:Os09g0536350, partial [Oryza sativa Japonica Group]
AEDDEVTGGAGGAGECGRGVVVGVAVGARARVLEELRVRRRPARRRRAERAVAAVLRRAERLARAPAGDAGAVGAGDLQVGGARPVQVDEAPRRAARRAAALGNHHHRQVGAVHEADVVEVVPAGAVEGELRQRRGRRRAAAAALHGARPAVARGAREPAGPARVGAAERPPPDAARPRRRRVHGERLPRRQREPRRGQRRRPGARQEPRPHRVRARVCQRERRAQCPCNNSNNSSS